MISYSEALRHFKDIDLNYVKFHLFIDILYPPPGPFSNLKLSKLIPKNPKMEFPRFFNPPITSYFLFY